MYIIAIQFSIVQYIYENVSSFRFQLIDFGLAQLETAASTRLAESSKFDRTIMYMYMYMRNNYMYMCNIYSFNR